MELSVAEAKTLNVDPIVVQRWSCLTGSNTEHQGRTAVPWLSAGGYAAAWSWKKRQHQALWYWNHEVTSHSLLFNHATFAALDSYPPGETQQAIELLAFVQGHNQHEQQTYNSGLDSASIYHVAIRTDRSPVAVLSYELFTKSSTCHFSRTSGAKEIFMGKPFNRRPIQADYDRTASPLAQSSSPPTEAEPAY
ncbi:uncharacterized protein LACBIDRAFT_335471 [Laccaria bicolor S238N-H82]|uniref:Predicted protein n=1 Tax=Laccaria bicolor (strain S238N-H82 / ATCC MYA-4686) TaxID=486041 RepID=B0E2G2_LACBS|nr:uncharacterized protein LACBIDRAFT_335471 [Laccaria bicolor S238N-H82]EDQ98962.1 predicted protein [Laccaria bicolor S238N-H82]|eukprot:XP_001890364.1 predicted protein [Laccaria bicolor S238N-H82]